MATQSRKPSSTHPIASTDAGELEVHVFEPMGVDIRGSVVTVHPWAALGGGLHNTVGIARRIATATSGPRASSREGGAGWRVITFALKSRNAVWGIFSNHSYEVQQTIDVVNWVGEKYGTDEIVLLGSSAGAPIAGTAMARLVQQRRAQHPQRCGISAYIAVGYTFGAFAALGFGRHFAAVVSTEDAPPKLFVMGERDEFTSKAQLERVARRMEANGLVDVEIVADAGHFELESSRYDPLVANVVVKWLDKVLGA